MSINQAARLFLYQGNTFLWPMTFLATQQPNVPLNITGYVIQIVIKDSNGNVLATLTSPAGGVTITDAVNGVAQAIYSTTGAWPLGEIVTQITTTDGNGTQVTYDPVALNVLAKI